LGNIGIFGEVLKDFVVNLGFEVKVEKVDIRGPEKVNVESNG
jgi:hypothetical protein